MHWGGEGSPGSVSPLPADKELSQKASELNPQVWAAEGISLYEVTLLFLCELDHVCCSSTAGQACHMCYLILLLPEKSGSLFGILSLPVLFPCPLAAKLLALLNHCSYIAGTMSLSPFHLVSGPKLALSQKLRCVGW